MDMSNEATKNQLVGYFDILGTKDRVQKGLFDDLAAWDFASPAGIVAKAFSSFRLAAFSDCVVMSAPASRPLDFLRAVNFLTGNWSEDLVFARGGIAIGEITWVDSMPHDRLFQLPNFSCARVYGKALVEAFTVEGASGPGVATFVSDPASDLFDKEIPGSILRGQSNVLVCLNQAEVKAWKCFFSDCAEREPHLSAARTHFFATVRILKMIENNGGGVTITRLLAPSESGKS